MMNLLMCPVCRQTLSLTDQTWRCLNHHSYDVATQGYVNLHVVQHKHSKNPGDTAESVQARRAFLSAGFYAPLQQAVVEKIRALKIETLLDIGCGEGYYTAAMQAEVQQCVGMDIAKNADFNFSFLFFCHFGCCNELRSNIVYIKRIANGTGR